MAGISDIRHELCLALALWNGNDPILKERMFGLTGPQGNHGEDVKEYWWYLEGLPSHALLRWRYHYPQAAFPYDAARAPRPRARRIPSSSCSTPASFDDDRYWSVDVTYAKASPTEVLMRIELENHGPDEATLDVLPTLWFRNTWSWEPGARRPRIERRRRRRSPSPTTGSPATGSRRRPGPTARARGALLRERDERAARLRRRARRRRIRRTASTTTSSRARRPSTRTASARRPRCATASPCPPAARPSCGCGCTGRERSPAAGAGPARRVRRGRRRARGRRRRVLRRARARGHRRRARCGSCGRPARASSGASRCTRTTCGAGSTATRASRRRPRRTATAATRLAPPRLVRRARDARPVGVPVVRGMGSRRSTASRGRTSIPRSRSTSCVVLLREWFQHPNGALPAYEWNFDDVNPPVHVMAALRVFVIDGGTRPRVPRAGLPEAARSTSPGGSTARTPTATTSSAAASSGSTTSARSTARTCPRASRSSRPTARRGWRTTRSRCS